jgi:predicted MFS family arabinose efflux permease
MDWIGWRGLFELLAAATAASAVLVYIMVPEQVAPPSKGPTPLSLKSVYANSDFWRLAPVSATCVGSAWALQGLWAAAWLTDVEELDRPSVVTQLLVMAIALSVGGFFLGSIADQMRRRGIGPEGCSPSWRWCSLLHSSR